MILARLAIAIGIEFEIERLDAKGTTKPISIPIKCFPRKDPRTPSGHQGAEVHAKDSERASDCASRLFAVRRTDERALLRCHCVLKDSVVCFGQNLVHGTVREGKIDGKDRPFFQLTFYLNPPTMRGDDPLDDGEA